MYMIEVSKRRLEPHFQYFYVKGIDSSKKVMEIMWDLQEQWSMLFERKFMPFVKTEPSSFLEILVLTGITEGQIKNYAEKNSEKDLQDKQALLRRL